MLEEIVVVLLSVGVSGLVSFFTSLYFTRRAEKKTQAKEIHETRPELDIVDYKKYSYFNSNKYGKKCDLEVFVASIQAVVFSDESYDAAFNGNIKNIDEWECVAYTFKNNGKTDITYLTIVSNIKKNIALFPTSFLHSSSIDFLNYYISYDKRKIRPGDSITINLFYHKDYMVGGFMSAPLSLVFKDDNGHRWSQAFWAPENKIYECEPLSIDKYKTMYSIDDALKCFKYPWLW